VGEAVLKRLELNMGSLMVRNFTSVERGEERNHVRASAKARV